MSPTLAMSRHFNPIKVEKKLEAEAGILDFSIKVLFLASIP